MMVRKKLVDSRLPGLAWVKYLHNKDDLNPDLSHTQFHIIHCSLKGGLHRGQCIFIFPKTIVYLFGTGEVERAEKVRTYSAPITCTYFFLERENTILHGVV